MAVQVILEKSLSELHKEAKKLESQPGWGYTIYD
jgi:hypothetical protein